MTDHRQQELLQLLERSVAAQCRAPEGAAQARTERLMKTWLLCNMSTWGLQGIYKGRPPSRASHGGTTVVRAIWLLSSLERSLV